MGVPLHFWAELTFRTIGGAIGCVKEVDSDAGRVRVVVNGFKSLTSVEFHSGEEILITLRYERLFGFCRRCFSLCHDESECGSITGVEMMRQGLSVDADVGPKMLSYKGATSGNGEKLEYGGGHGGVNGNRHSKRPVSDGSNDDNGFRRLLRDTRPYRARAGSRADGESSRNNRAREAYPGNVRRSGHTGLGMTNEQKRLISREKNESVTQTTVVVEEADGSEVGTKMVGTKMVDTWHLATGKKIRKGLFQKETEAVIAPEGGESLALKEVFDQEEVRSDIDTVMSTFESGSDDKEQGDSYVQVDHVAEEELEMGEVKEDKEIIGGEQGQQSAELGPVDMEEAKMGLAEDHFDPLEDEILLANGELVLNLSKMDKGMDFDDQLAETIEPNKKMSPKPQRKKLVKGTGVINGMA